MVKVFFYIIILYCYVVEFVDGKMSIEDDLLMIKEYLFVILDDEV